MRKNILTRLFFVGALAVGAGACTEEYDSDSAIATWATSAQTMLTPAEIDECSKIYTVTVTFDDKQATNLHLAVGVGESSTATEGEDFELVTHDIEVPALAGQDGVSFDIEVFEDYVIEESETLYITLTSDVPSNVAAQEFLAFTINDSGLEEAATTAADFELSWKYTTGGATNCAYDLDMTFQTQGNPDPYDAADLLGYGTASLACPEVGGIDIDDMIEGQLYDINVLVYAGDDAQPMTVEIDYAREGTSFNGTMSIVGVFDASMNGDLVVVGTIEKNCGILTIKDPAGAVVGQGRVAPKYPVVHNIVKPF